MDPLFIISYLGLGVVAGFLGGLLGIGGGVIMVPALVALFTYSGWDKAL
jgi:uncharacterized membrane protein YfcA